MVDADYARIHQLEVSGALFVAPPPSTEASAADQDAAAPAEATPSLAVVVVDPFSTGAVVAAYCNKAKLPCVCVYSGEGDE